MIQIGTENRSDAARHEAGHAVIGTRSGCKPTTVHIRLDNGRWVGECGFERQKVSEEDLAAIAIAGCLAQAKSVAQREHGLAARFKRSGPLKELVGIICDVDRNTPDSQPGTCDMVFLVGEQEVSIRFDGAWLSGADAGQYRSARKAFLTNSADIQLIRSVMDELDEPRNWRAVCAVAEELCRQPPSEDTKLVLSGTSVTALVTQSE